MTMNAKKEKKKKRKEWMRERARRTISLSAVCTVQSNSIATNRMKKKIVRHSICLVSCCFFSLSLFSAYLLVFHIFHILHVFPESSSTLKYSVKTENSARTHMQTKETTEYCNVKFKYEMSWETTSNPWHE